MLYRVFDSDKNYIGAFYAKTADRATDLAQNKVERMGFEWHGGFAEPFEEVRGIEI